MIELKPIRETTEDYDKIEKRILEVFKRDFFFPILRILGKNDKTLRNDILDDLERALVSGKIIYTDGMFKGKFGAQISLQLKKLGAKWDNRRKAFILPLDKLPISVKLALSLSKIKQEEKLQQVDKLLEGFDTTLFADKVQVKDLFDASLFKVEKEFKQSVKHITVAPELPPEQRGRIAEGWQTNLRLDIKKFSDAQVLKLREMVHENLFVAGNRREELHSSIERMLLSINKDWPNVKAKAKFLAKQETSLAMAAYKQTRYEAAGVKKYRWACVKMPHQPSPKAPYKPGEVRYGHGILEGKVFTWDNPPITTNPTAKTQRRNNPGQDFNCRCYAVPIVEFNDESMRQK